MGQPHRGQRACRQALELSSAFDICKDRDKCNKVYGGKPFFMHGDTARPLADAAVSGGGRREGLLADRHTPAGVSCGGREYLWMRPAASSYGQKTGWPARRRKWGRTDVIGRLVAVSRTCRADLGRCVGKPIGRLVEANGRAETSRALAVRPRSGGRRASRRGARHPSNGKIGCWVYSS